MTGQEFENHIIFEKLEQFKKRISDNEIRESVGIEDINFFETAYGYFLDRLRLTIPVIVQETELTTISQEVESSLSQINNFIGNKNYGHITNAKNNLYSATTRVRNLPLPFSKNDFNFSKNISTFEKIVQEKYNNLEKENKELKQTLDELNNEIKSNKTELKRIKSSLEQKELEIQNINSTFQTDFANIKATANQNYDAVFTVTKSEIEDFLLSKTLSGENFIDIFGDWILEFRFYHHKKNEPLCRDIQFTFSDESEWSIKFIDLLTIKAKDKDYIINFKDPIVTDEKLLNEYIQSLTWEDVKHYAEELKRPQPEPNYEKEWADCTKTIVQWEDTIDILDFLELDDKIYEEEEDDD